MKLATLLGWAKELGCNFVRLHIIRTTTDDPTG